MLSGMLSPTPSANPSPTRCPISCMSFDGLEIPKNPVTALRISSPMPVTASIACCRMSRMPSTSPSRMSLPVSKRSIPSRYPVISSHCRMTMPSGWYCQNRSMMPESPAPIVSLSQAAPSCAAPTSQSHPAPIAPTTVSQLSRSRFIPAIGAVTGKRNARMSMWSMSHSAPATIAPTVLSQAFLIQSIAPVTTPPTCSHRSMNQPDTVSQFDASR